MYGGAGDDQLFGDAGDDFLDGGTGVDHMEGKGGNDTYVVDHVDDVVVEVDGEGDQDTVLAKIDYELQDDSYVENLILDENVIKGGGSDSDNSVIGNASNNELSGGLGADKLYGGAGNDLLFAEDKTTAYSVMIPSSDTSENELYGGEGNDSLFGASGNDLLSGGVGNDKLLGGDGDDDLSGDTGNDIVAGGLGSDLVKGGEGRDAIGGGAFYDSINDTYWLKDDNAADRLEGGSGYDFYFADSLDVISDSDGKGVVYFQSNAQGDLGGNEGGLWWRLYSAYETDVGSGVFESFNWSTGETLSYSLNGSTLSINGELSIENFSDGDLGIRLVEKEEPADPPLPNPPPTPASPLVLDLDGDGVETLGLDQDIYFDLDNSGFSELSGWVGKDDGLLVLDRDGNGNIDNGSELFGNHTQLQSGEKAENGFAALAELDTNADGVISIDDAAYADLQVWQDANSNGEVDSGELHSLSDFNIAQLNLGYSASSFVDDAGNAHAQVGHYTLANGIERDLTDVWFDTNTQENNDTPATDIPDDIAALPNIAAAGNVASLQQAMAADASGQLQVLVEQFVAAQTQSEKNAVLEDLLFQWVGETGDYEQHFQSLIDRRKIHTLEAFYGYELPNPRGGGWQYTELYERLFQQFSNTIYSQIVGQTHLSDYADTLVYTTNSEGEPAYDFDVLTNKLLFELGELTSEEGEQLLNDLYQYIDGLNPYEGTSFSNNEGESITEFKQQVKDFIGTDIIDTLFEGYIGNIDAELEAKLRSSADQLLNLVSGATMYDDVVIGTDAAERLNGLLGGDVIDAGGGDDIILGGQGDDRLKGGLGNDQYRYYLGDGHDSIFNDSSDDAADLIYIYGVTQAQLIINRQGDDLLISFQDNEGSIRVEGQFQNEGVNTNHVQEIVLDDGSRIGVRVDTFNIVNQNITEGDDVYHASLGDDAIDVAGGDDALFGKSGNDVLGGGAGHDRIYGDEGNDTLDGGEGHDFLYGGDGDDIITGGLGNDILRGNLGNDRFLFETGDGIDALLDKDGDNVIELGEGTVDADLVVSRNGSDLIIDFAGRPDDQLTLSEFFTGLTHSQNWTLQFADNSQLSSDQLVQLTLRGTQGNDIIRGLYSDNSIDGRGGNDTLTGNVFNDVIIGGTGDDILKGRAGSDTYLFNLGDGRDSILDIRGDDEVNTLKFGENITREDLLLRKVGNHLSLSIIGSDDNVRIEQYFHDSAYHLRVELQDGSVISHDDILAAILVSTDNDDVIYALDTNDTINLLDGDDQAYGEGGDDVINGEAGNDRIVGGSGDDQISGGLGQDNLSGDAGDDYLNGGAGNDALDGGAGADTLLGEAGDDIVRGWSGNDILDGGDGNDILQGGEGDDQLYAGAGNDELQGNLGNDTYFINTDAGQNTIYNRDNDGANSIDKIVFSSDISPEDVQLLRVNDDLHILLADSLTLVDNYFDADASNQTHLVDVLEFTNGTNWNVETIKAMVLLGNDSEQTLLGYATDDDINAAGGNDTVYGRGGDDTLYGELGDDILYGGAGNDTLNGGQGDDQLNGNSGVDILDGGDGDDVLHGGADNDVLYGGSGVDTLYGDSGSDTLHGGDDNDNLYGNGLLLGESGNDYLEGSGILDGGVGDDYLLSLGADTLIGGEGNDILVAATDVFDVSSNDLSGGLGNDTLYGSNGDETYRFNVGDGQDLIIETKADEAYSNIDASNDTLVFGAGINRDSIDLIRRGLDLIIMVGTAGDQITVQNWFREPTEHFKINRLLFSDETELSATQIEAQVRYEGTAGEDLLVGYRDYDDQIYAGDGDDQVFGREGNDDIFGGAGDDYLDGDEGDDHLRGGDGADNLVGRVGDDYLEGEAGNDTLQGMEGNDILIGGAGQDNMTGGSGNDSLYGGADRDLMSGDAGDDFLDAGAGDDQLTGGAGDDTYITGTGDDMIVVSDNDGHDVVDVSAGGVNGILFSGNVTIDRIQFTQEGDDLLILIDDGATQSIRVSNHFLGGESAIDWVQPANDFQITTAQINQLAAGGSTGDYDAVVEGTSDGEQLVGTSGNDLIRGLGGSDQLFGLAGNDQLEGGDGDDRLQGGNGGISNSGDDILLGGEGSDILVGEDGNDYLDGGNGNDHYYYYDNSGQDVVSDAGDGQDILFFIEASLHRLSFHQEGDDLIVLVDGDLTQQVRVENHFLGGDYEIRVQPNGGNTQTPTAIAALLSDLPEEGDTGGGDTGGGDTGGGDTGGGDTGDLDTDNVLSGSVNNDVIASGAGNDTLSGLEGSDILIGGTGDDTYVIESGGGSDVIVDYEGTNTLRFAAGITFNDVASGLIKSGDDLILSIASTGDEVRVENFFALSNTIETLTFDEGGSLSAAQLFGAFGVTAPTESKTSGELVAGDASDDVLSATSGHDVLLGVDGNDSLAGEEGDDLLVGGNGDDTYVIGASSGSDLIIDTQGVNKILFTDGIVFNDVASGLLKSGDDLVLSVGSSGDEVRIAQFFSVTNTISTLEFESGGELTAAQLFGAFGVAAPTESVITESGFGLDTSAQMQALVSAMSAFDVPEDTGDMIASNDDFSAAMIEIA
ncbi:MAG: hypothetical protein JKY66_08170 [Spongiibacteraceae bacterium]|nr:hypothetical protein [Spongiibacteraceae bacterium]